jgi:hypothetical protein
MLREEVSMQGMREEEVVLADAIIMVSVDDVSGE